MPFSSILLPFRLKPCGWPGASFALDLAKRLGLPVDVAVPSDDDADIIRANASFAAEAGHGDAAPYMRVNRKTTLVRHEDPLVVSGEAACVGDADALDPKDERSLYAKGGHEALIPLGNGPSGLRAAVKGVPFAKRLGLSVAFYHTTWLNPEIASDDPASHVHATAAAVISEAQALAASLGVRSRVIVETAETVAEGVCRAALRENCPLVVMARGKDTLRGSYVDQVLARTPVPTLVVGGVR